jgi:hypothetical protein
MLNSHTNLHHRTFSFFFLIVYITYFNRKQSSSGDAQKLAQTVIKNMLNYVNV